MGQVIEPTLALLRYLLFRVYAEPYEYVLFGSTVLYLQGLRESVGDVDVFVSKRVYDKLAEMIDEGRLIPSSSAVSGREIKGTDGDPPLLEYNSNPPLHIFYAWTERDREWMNVEECFARAEYAGRKGVTVGLTGWGGPWRAIPLDLVRKHKRLAETHDLGSEARMKHLRDLEVLDEVLPPWDPVRPSRPPERLWEPSP